jgi:hypothetical protein
MEHYFSVDVRGSSQGKKKLLDLSRQAERRCPLHAEIARIATIPLPDSLIARLKNRHKNAPHERWIFVNEEGRPDNHFLPSSSASQNEPA